MSIAFRGTWVVWILVSLSAVSVLVGIVLAWFVDLNPAPPDSFAFRGFDAVAGIAYVAIAMLILHRQPSHGIGAMFLAIGLFSTLYWMVSEYGYAAELGDTGWPGGAYAAWLNSWAWILLVIPILSFIPALFPSGKLENRFDRGLTVLGGLAVVVGYLAYGTRPGLLLDQAAYANNPLPIGFLPHSALEGASTLSLGVIAIGGVVALIRSYRQGSETERLQIKWLTAAITFLGSAFASIALLFLVVPEWAEERLLFLEIVVFLGILTIPASIGFAITRYKLYDIEVVINRAVAYGPLTALVAGSYVGAVQLARLGFVALTGDRSDSELLVATLIAAAVFWTIRARMVRMVDQHFKDPREPAKDLRALGESLDQMTRIIEPAAVSRERLADFVLRSCVKAFEADGGKITLRSARGEPTTVGALSDAPPVSVDIVHQGTVLGTLLLGARAKRRPYSQRDRAPLEETASVLAEILARIPNSETVNKGRPTKKR